MKKRRRNLLSASDTPIHSLSDLTRMQAHYEVFCLFEELAGKDYNHFRSFADLGEDVKLVGAEREGRRNIPQLAATARHSPTT